MHKVARKSGAVWEFLWREDGKQKHIVVGPVKKYRTRAEAQRQVEHIRLRINAKPSLPGIATIGNVVGHYIAAEINATNPRLSYATRCITLDTYTQAAVPSKRAAQERVIRLVLGQSYNLLQTAGSA